MNLSLDGPLLCSFGIGKFSPPFITRNDSIKVTILNMVGYLPGISILSSIFRVVMAKAILSNSSASVGLKKVSYPLIGRGIIEMLGIGILLAPFDIGCTIARFFTGRVRALE